MSVTDSAASTRATVEPGGREIVMERDFAAPRDLVFRAYTEQEHVEAWWGPYGFTTTTYEMDVRPGGQWRYTMHGPDGTDYPNRMIYREVVRPERLSYAHDDDGKGEISFDVTVTFEETEGGTRVTMRTITASPEVRDHLASFGAVEGGQQTLARLAEHLKTM